MVLPDEEIKSVLYVYPSFNFIYATNKIDNSKLSGFFNAHRNFEEFFLTHETYRGQFHGSIFGREIKMKN